MLFLDIMLRVSILSLILGNKRMIVCKLTQIYLAEFYEKPRED